MDSIERNGRDASDWELFTEARPKERVEEAWLEGFKTGTEISPQEKNGCLFKYNGVSLADKLFAEWQALKKQEGVK